VASEKTINTRVQMKSDTAANWAKATSFTPKKGEIIVYNDNPPHIKIGDGTTKVNNLSFATSSVYVGSTKPSGNYDIWIDTSSNTATDVITAVIFTQDEKTKLAGITSISNDDIDAICNGTVKAASEVSV